MTQYEDYIISVDSGKLLSCKYVKQAVRRHLNDLKKSKRKHNKYYFSEEWANAAINVVCELRHTATDFAGKKFNLQPFQAFIIAMIFGWRRKDNGKRRYNKTYIEMARKNGKTELAAAIAWVCAILEQPLGGEFYSVATKKDQAKKWFDAVKYMGKQLAREDEAFDDKFRILTYNISSEELNIKMSYLSSDEDTLDGLNPFYVCIDELHAHPTGGVYKVMETGMSSWDDSLLNAITTAGFNLNSFCYSLRKTCIDVLAERKRQDNQFIIIYTIDDEDDWKDPNVWVKANPCLGNTPKLQKFEEDFQGAVNEGGVSEIQFKTKNLNMWTATSTTFIKDEEYLNCVSDWSHEAMRGSTCFAGLDLASTLDYAVYAQFFPSYEEGGKHRSILKYFIPEEKANSRRGEKVDFLRWQNEGHLIVTPGNVTDYNYIHKYIVDSHDFCNVKMIYYDRHNASQLVINLTEEGIQMKPFSQAIASMNAPTVQISKMIRNKEMDFGVDPVLRWMFSNIQLAMDTSGNIKIDKAKSSDRVDGPVALVMAVAAWMIGGEVEPEESVYEKLARERKLKK